MGDNNKDSIKFDVKLRTKDIFSLMFNYSYFGLMGIVTAVICIACIVLYVLKFREMDMAGKIIIFAVFLIYMAINPIMLYTKAKKQAAASEKEKPVTYEVSSENIVMGQGVRRDSCPWGAILKVRETRQALLLYISKYTAFIWPKDQMGEENTVKAREFIRSSVPGKRVRIKG